MSGRPSTEGARALLAAVTEAETIVRELPELQDERRTLDAEIKLRAERHAELWKEIGRLLSEMDVDVTGNYGWQERFTALLSEMLRLDRKQREAPGAGESEGTP